MNAFDKRPLSLILCIMLGGFVVFSISGEPIKIACAVAVPLLAFLPLFLSRTKGRKILCIIAAICLALSIIASHFYFRWFKAYERFDGICEISGTVVEAKRNTSYSSYFVIQTESINEEKNSRYKLALFISTDDSLGMTVGARVSFKAEIAGFDSEDDFDLEKMYFSDGISGKLEGISDLKVELPKEEPLSVRLSFIRENIRRHAILMSDADSGTLFGALITGERSELSDSLRLDFKRIGISHVLALSGMHLAILSLGIGKLLELFRLNKKIRTAAIIGFSLLYMFFTGFSVSVVRAGIMLIISSLLFLCSRTSDSLTSLSIAVFIICLSTPYAIFDIVLWLSAFATLGVIMSVKEKNADTGVSGIRRVLLGMWEWFVVGFKSSVFAIGATLAISAFTFGGISIVSPISTMIFSPLIEIIMYLGTVMIFVGYIIPLGIPLTYITKFTTYLASIISDFEYSYLPINYDFIKWMIIAVTVVYFILICIKANKKVTSAVITCSLMAVFACTLFFSISENTSDRLIYACEDKSDMFLLKSADSVALVDSSQYSESIAYSAISLLEDNNIRELDTYIATHYAYKLEDELLTLLSYYKIDNISLPLPRNDDEKIVLTKIEKALSEFRTEIVFHAHNGNITVGEFTVTPIFYVAYGEGTSTNAFEIRLRDKRYLYLSSGMLTDEYIEYTGKYLPLCDTLILGRHGKKYKEKDYFTKDYDNIELIIAESENMFFTPDSLEYYTKNGRQVEWRPSKISILGE